MDRRQLEILKAIYGSNKQYDNGGNMLSQLSSIIGPTLGTVASGNKHTTVGDALIGLSPAAGITSMAAKNYQDNRSVKSTIKENEPLIDSVTIEQIPQINYTPDLPVYASFGGQLATAGIGAGVSAGLAGIGAIINRGFGNNKQAIQNTTSKIQNAMAQNSQVNNIHSTEGLADATVNTNFNYNRSDYGWFNGSQYRKDQEMANANKQYAANIIPHAAQRIDTQNDLSLRANYSAFGGNLGTAGSDFSTGMTHINNGDTHEANPYQGVQLGVDPQGTPNLVEEGETVYNDYVFSNRLKVPKQRLKKGQKKLTQEERILHKYEGKTYAEAAKKAEKDSGADERPNDNIARRGFETTLEILAQSQEQERAKEKDNQANSEIKQYIESMSPEDKEALIAQLRDRLMQQAQGEVPQDVDPRSQQEQAEMSPEEQQAMAQQMSPEQQAMMQQQAYPDQQQMMQQQAMQQQMDPQQQAMMQQQMQQQMSPEQQAAMQQQSAQPQMNAYGGRLFAEGGQADPQMQQAMMQQAMQQQAMQQSTQDPQQAPQEQQMSPEEMAMMQQQQGGEQQIPQEAEQAQDQEPTPPQQSPDQSEPSPADQIDTDVDVEDMSTNELNKTLKQIIDYAKETGDKQLAREARKVKNKGSRVEKEDFVKDALEEIKEDQQQQEVQRAYDETNQQQQEQQMQQEAMQQNPQEEIPQEAMQDPMAQGSAQPADAGAALDAQMQPQQEMQEPQVEQQQMMSNGGQFAYGGTITMNATLAGIYDRNRSNPTIMSKFKRLYNTQDPQLQDDIAREIIELDRDNRRAYGGKLYADGGDMQSQISQAKQIYAKIAQQDPNITQLYDQVLKSITPEAATQIQQQYGCSAEDYAILATVSNYSQQANQNAYGGRLNMFAGGGSPDTESAVTSTPSPTPATPAPAQQPPEITPTDEDYRMVDQLFKKWGIGSSALKENIYLKQYRETLAKSVHAQIASKRLDNEKYKPRLKDMTFDSNIMPDLSDVAATKQKQVVSDYAMKEYLISNGWAKTDVNNKNLLQYTHTGMKYTPISEDDPYKFYSNKANKDKLYMDENGNIYQGANIPKLGMFDISKHGIKFDGNFANDGDNILSNQGFYLAKDDDSLYDDPFLTVSNYNFNEANKRLAEYYNQQMFDVVASSRGSGVQEEKKTGKKYYIDKSTKKKVYFDRNTALNGPRSSDWSKVYLRGDELRTLYKRGKNKDSSAEAKFLSNALEKMWGDGITNDNFHLRTEKKPDGSEYGEYSSYNNPEGYLTETPWYRQSYDYRTGATYGQGNRTNDGMAGMDHTPVSISPNTVNTFFITDKDGKLRRVVLNNGVNPNDLNTTLRDTITDDRGWRINRYIINDDAQRYAVKVGDDVYTIAGDDNFNPAQYGLEATDQIPYKDDKVDGVTLTTNWLTANKNAAANANVTPKLEFPFPKDLFGKIGLGIQAGTTLYNIARKPDYSNANAIAELAAQSGRLVDQIQPPAIGNYLAYKPYDRNYEGYKIIAQGAQGNRLLASLSGGNRGNAQANIIANDSNTLSQLGAKDISAFDTNRKQEQAVEEFNRGTNVQNANWRLDADKANQAARNNAFQLKGQYTKDAMEMRNKIDEGKAAAINAGLSGFVGMLATMQQQNYQNALQKYAIDKGYVEPTMRYKGQNTQSQIGYKAKGGKLRKRRKRTFNL